MSHNMTLLRAAAQVAAAAHGQDWQRRGVRVASLENANVTLGQHTSLQPRKDVVLVLFRFLFVLWG